MESNVFLFFYQKEDHIKVPYEEWISNKNKCIALARNEHKINSRMDGYYYNREHKVAPLAESTLAQ